MNPPSIAILHYTASPIVGGVEAVIQAHVEVFVSKGHRCGVIAGRGDGRSYPQGVDFQLIPEIDSQHPEILEMNAELEHGEIPAQFGGLRDRLIEDLKPHLIGYDRVIVHNIFTKHFNLALTAALQELLKQGIFSSCIAWCHDFTWTSPSSREKVHPGYPGDLLRTKWDAVEYVVVSKERRVALAELFDCPLDEITVVYNGVDPQILFGLSDQGKALASRLSLLESDLILLMPVRVTKAKNIEFALQVLKDLKARGLRSRLILTGPPDPHDVDNLAYYRSLRDLRAELGVEDEMHFIYELGVEEGDGLTIDMATVSELIRMSDIVFLPSHREGFGMPVLEAGLLGVPVIASEIPAAREIAGEFLTVIDTSQSPEKVAEDVSNWAERDPLHQLRRRVRQSYTWEAIYEHAILPLLDREGN